MQTSSSTLEFKFQLTGHNKPITASVFNSRRNQILTADESSLRLWSFRKELRQIPLIGPKIKTLLYSKVHDVYIAVRGGNPEAEEANSLFTILAASVEVLHASLATLMRFKAHSQTITSAAINVNGNLFTTASGDGSIKFWNLNKNVNGKMENNKKLPNNSLRVMKCRSSISNVGVMTVMKFEQKSPSSQYDEEFLISSCNNSFFIWKVSYRENANENEEGKREVVQDFLLASDIGISCNILSLSFIPQKEIAIIGTSDGRINIFNVTSSDFHLVSSSIVHSGSIFDISLPYDGLTYFTCGGDGIVKQFDTEQYKEIGRYTHQILRSTHLDRMTQKQSLTLAAVPKIIMQAAVNGPYMNKHLLLVAAGNVVTILQVHSFVSLIGSIPGAQPSLTLCLDFTSLNSNSFSDAKVATFSIANSISCINVEINKSSGLNEVETLYPSSSLEVRDIIQTMDNKSGSKSKSFIPTSPSKYGKGKGKESFGLLGDITCLRWISELGAYVIGWSTGAIEIFPSFKTDQQQSRLLLPESGMGKRINDCIFIRYADPSHSYLIPQDIKEDSSIFFTPNKLDSFGFTSIGYLLTSSYDGSIQKWSLKAVNENMPLKHTFQAHTTNILSLVFYQSTEIGKSCIISACKDGFIKTWDPFSFRMTGYISRKNTLNCFAVIRSNTKIVLGFDNGETEVWEMPIEESSIPNFVTKSQKHSLSVTSIVVSFNENIYLTSSMDCSINIWDSNTFTFLRSISFSLPVQRVIYINAYDDAAVLLNECVYKTYAGTNENYRDVGNEKNIKDRFNDHSLVIDVMSGSNITPSESNDFSLETPNSETINIKYTLNPDHDLHYRASPVDLEGMSSWEEREEEEGPPLKIMTDNVKGFKSELHKHVSPKAYTSFPLKDYTVTKIPSVTDKSHSSLDGGGSNLVPQLPMEKESQRLEYTIQKMFASVCNIYDIVAPINAFKILVSIIPGSFSWTQFVETMKNLDISSTDMTCEEVVIIGKSLYEFVKTNPNFVFVPPPKTPFVLGKNDFQLKQLSYDIMGEGHIISKDINITQAGKRRERRAELINTELTITRQEERKERKSYKYVEKIQKRHYIIPPFPSHFGSMWYLAKEMPPTLGLQTILPHKYLLLLINKICVAKMDSDKLDLVNKKKTHAPFSEFLYTWFRNQFGFIHIAQNKLLIMFDSLLQNMSGHLEYLFARFCGLVPNEPIDADSTQLYFELRKWVLVREAVASHYTPSQHSAHDLFNISRPSTAITVNEYSKYEKDNINLKEEPASIYRVKEAIRIILGAYVSSQQIEKLLNDVDNLSIIAYEQNFDSNTVNEALDDRSKYIDMNEAFSMAIDCWLCRNISVEDKEKGVDFKNIPPYWQNPLDSRVVTPSQLFRPSTVEVRQMRKQQYQYLKDMINKPIDIAFGSVKEKENSNVALPNIVIPITDAQHTEKTQINDGRFQVIPSPPLSPLTNNKEDRLKNEEKKSIYRLRGLQNLLNQFLNHDDQNTGLITNALFRNLLCACDFPIWGKESPAFSLPDIESLIVAFKADKDTVRSLRNSPGPDADQEIYISYLDLWSTIYAIGLESPPSIYELCQTSATSSLNNTSKGNKTDEKISKIEVDSSKVKVVTVSIEPKVSVNDKKRSSHQGNSETHFDLHRIKKKYNENTVLAALADNNISIAKNNDQMDSQQISQKQKNLVSIVEKEKFIDLLHLQNVQASQVEQNGNLESSLRILKPSILEYKFAKQTSTDVATVNYGKRCSCIQDVEGPQVVVRKEKPKPFLQEYLMTLKSNRSTFNNTQYKEEVGYRESELSKEEQVSLESIFINSSAHFNKSLPSSLSYENIAGFIDDEIVSMASGTQKDHKRDLSYVDEIKPPSYFSKKSKDSSKRSKKNFSPITKASVSINEDHFPSWSNSDLNDFNFYHKDVELDSRDYTEMNPLPTGKRNLRHISKVLDVLPPPKVVDQYFNKYFTSKEPSIEFEIEARKNIYIRFHDIEPKSSNIVGVSKINRLLRKTEKKKKKGYSHEQDAADALLNRGESVLSLDGFSAGLDSPDSMRSKSPLDDLDKAFDKQKNNFRDRDTGTYLAKAKPEKVIHQPVRAKKTLSTQPKPKPVEKKVEPPKPKPKPAPPPPVIVEKPKPVVIVPEKIPTPRVPTPRVPTPPPREPTPPPREPTPPPREPTPPPKEPTPRDPTPREPTPREPTPPPREPTPPPKEPTPPPTPPPREPTPPPKDPTPPPTPPPTQEQVAEITERLIVKKARVPTPREPSGDLEVYNPMTFSDDVVVRPLKGLLLNGINQGQAATLSASFFDDDDSDVESEGEIIKDFSALYDSDAVYPHDISDLPPMLRVEVVDWETGMTAKEKKMFPLEVKIETDSERQMRMIREAKHRALERKKAKNKVVEEEVIPLKVGDKIESRLGGGQKFLPGKIFEIIDSESFKIQYDDGNFESYVPQHFVRRPVVETENEEDVEDIKNVYKVGDEVLSRFEGELNFIPGVIQAIPIEGDSEPLFTVKYINGRVEERIPFSFLAPTGQLTANSVHSGDPVEVYISGDLFYHPAIISNVNNDTNTVDVKISKNDEDIELKGKTKTIPLQCVRVDNEALANQIRIPKFEKNEQVEVKNINQLKYKKAIILNNNGDDTYDIEYINGVVEKDVYEHFIAKSGSYTKQPRDWDKMVSERTAMMESGLLQVLDLSFGEPIEESIAEGGPPSYFTFLATDPKSIFTVELDVNYGEPDLYISTGCPPSVIDYKWSSISAFGDNRILISPEDALYEPMGPYYVSVVSHDDCSFKITAHEFTGEQAINEQLQNVEKVTQKLNTFAPDDLQKKSERKDKISDSNNNESRNCNKTRVSEVTSNFPLWTQTEADEEDAVYDEMLIQLQSRETTVKKFFDPKLLSALKLHLRANEININNISESDWTNSLKEDVKSAVTIWGPRALKFILEAEIAHKNKKLKKIEEENIVNNENIKKKDNKEKSRVTKPYKYRNPPRYVPAWHCLLRMPVVQKYAIQHTDRSLTPTGEYHRTSKPVYLRASTPANNKKREQKVEHGNDHEIQFDSSERTEEEEENDVTNGNQSTFFTS